MLSAPHNPQDEVVRPRRGVAGGAPSVATVTRLYSVSAAGPLAQ